MVKSTMQPPTSPGAEMSTIPVEREEGVYRTLIQTSFDGFCIADLSGRILDVNEAYCQMLGYTREEFLRLQVRDFEVSESPEETTAHFQKIIRTGNDRFQTRQRRKDGAVIEVEASVQYVSELGERIFSFIRDITERKKMEEALCKSNERFDLAAKGTNDGIWDWDIRTNANYFSPRFMELLGYGPDEVEHELATFESFLHPEDRAWVFDRVRQHLEDKVPYNVEYRMRTKNGEYRWFQARGEAARDQSGKPFRMAGSITDISGRKQAEEGLRLRAQLLDSASDTIFVVDFNGNFVYLNEAAWKTRGYTRDEMMSLNLHVLDTPMYEKLIESRMKDLMENGQCIFESEHRRKDGSVMPVEINAHTIESGGRKLVLGVIRDITERKQAEEKLLKSGAQMQAVLESLSESVVVLDTSGTVVSANDAATRLFGRTLEELIDPETDPRWKIIRSDGSLFPVEEQPAIVALRTGVPVQNVEMGVPLPDGTFRWVLVNAQLMRDSSGTTLGVVASSFDITGRKQTEAKILAVEAELQRLLDVANQSRRALLSVVEDQKRADAATQHANRALAALSAVNRNLVHAIDENELLQTICDVIVKQKDYRMVWVGYVQHDENKSIKIMAHAGHDEGYLDAMQLTWAETERGMGPSGRAVRSGKTQLCQDMANDPLCLPWRDAAQQHGYVASIALPLLSGDNAVFGILNVYAEEVNAFTPSEIDLLEEMAGDLAFGVRGLHTRQERDLTLIKNQEQLVQLQDSLEDTVRAMAAIVEMRDPYTAGHQIRVADLSTEIAKQMTLPEEQIHAIHLAGIVHDLGKIRIPAEILSKPGKITDLEFGLIKTHAQAGYDILKDINFPWPIALMVLQHHERLDGSGYPQGLKGDAILLEARILSVADVVEAICSHRPYRPGLGIEVALEEIIKNRGKFYDPQVVDACLAVFREQGYSFA